MTGWGGRGGGTHFPAPLPSVLRGEREGGGSRISLCLFVFLSKHLLSIYCGPGIVVNAFHALSGRIHVTALLLESHSSEEATKAQKG